ncbi:MAG: ParB/RepB/Spo0J family partition protein [Parachlamydiaceae bacterium]|nr:ParB/RepB/Spo0J family partition protein [Parachlamydiaceae bacterium]
MEDTPIILDDQNSRANEEIKQVDIDCVFVNPFQPRRHFAQEELLELAQSILAVGLIHPPVVRPRPDGLTYELVSGERRYRATQLAGLKTIAVLVRASSHEISAQAALIENIQRVDLNPIEIAKALHSLTEQFGLQQEVLAIRIGKKRSTVSNYLRLLTLPKSIQDGVSSNSISMGHAKAILSLNGFEKQSLLFEIILRDDLNVREAEEAALRISEKSKKERLVYTNRNFFLEQIAERIQQKLGTKVNIQGKGKKGKITINYYNLDDLDRLIAIFEA